MFNRCNHSSESQDINEDLWGENVEVSRPVGSAGELAFVLGRDAGVFGNPNHGGAQSTGVQVEAVVGLALLLTEALTCRQLKVRISTHSLIDGWRLRCLTSSINSIIFKSPMIVGTWKPDCTGFCVWLKDTSTCDGVVRNRATNLLAGGTRL